MLTKGLECTLDAIKIDIPLQLWSSLTSIAGHGLPLWFIRLLHNKPRYFTVNFMNCYVHYLSPKFWLEEWGIIKVFTALLIIFFIFRFIPKSKKIIVGLLLLMPFIFIFKLYPH
jgi:hypothetical protein